MLPDKDLSEEGQENGLVRPRTLKSGLDMSTPKSACDPLCASQCFFKYLNIAARRGDRACSRVSLLAPRV